MNLKWIRVVVSAVFAPKRQMVIQHSVKHRKSKSESISLPILSCHLFGEVAAVEGLGWMEELK